MISTLLKREEEKMTNNLIFQAVQKKSREDARVQDRNYFELENENKFKLTLKEYMHLFGGVNEQCLGQSTFRSFQLAQYHLGLTEEYTNCFYINNFILNQDSIEKDTSIDRKSVV